MLGLRKETLLLPFLSMMIALTTAAQAQVVEQDKDEDESTVAGDADPAADNEVQDEANPTLHEDATPPAAPEELSGPVATAPTDVIPPDIQDKEAEPEETSNIPETTVRRKPSTIFALGLGKVQELGKYDHYERLYGKKERMINLQTGYYLYTFGIDIGLSAKLGYYTAKGHPLKSLSGVTVPLKGNLPPDAALDPKQNIELTLIPVQTLIEVAYSPFPTSRRLTLRGWFGPEFLFVQETLKPNLPSGVVQAEGTTSVSKGWNQGIVTGVALSISVHGIESRSDYALKSIGVDRTYVSPYVEFVKSTKEKMGNYDRKIYGINLTFEGLR